VIAPDGWVAVLREHQPSVFGGCLCGWDGAVDMLDPRAPGVLLAGVPVADHGAMARHQADQLAEALGLDELVPVVPEPEGELAETHDHDTGSSPQAQAAVCRLPRSGQRPARPPVENPRPDVTGCPSEPVTG
jgi:hypothetical protein